MIWRKNHPFRNILWNNFKLHLPMNVRTNGFIESTRKLKSKRCGFAPCQIVILYLIPFFLILAFPWYALILEISYLFSARLELVLRFFALLPCCTSSLTVVWQGKVPIARSTFGTVFVLILPIRSFLVAYQVCRLLCRVYVFTLWNWWCSVERKYYSGYNKVWPDLSKRLLHLWDLLCNYWYGAIIATTREPSVVVRKILM